MGYDITTTGDKEAYFRLNIWGMGEARDSMMRLGMLSLDPGPEYPDREPGEDDETYNFRIYDEWSDFVPTPITGIPAYKLCSNDGWYVDPDEIKEALRRYDVTTETQRLMACSSEFRNRFDEWIRYLRLAQSDGGFRVY